VKVTEITESVIEENVLSVNNFEKLMKIIRKEICNGDINLIRVKNRILQKWNSGERICQKYDDDLIDLGTTVRKLIK
jgi:hypothetical protein